MLGEGPVCECVCEHVCKDFQQKVGNNIIISTVKSGQDQFFSAQYSEKYWGHQSSITWA